MSISKTIDQRADVGIQSRLAKGLAWSILLLCLLATIASAWLEFYMRSGTPYFTEDTIQSTFEWLSDLLFTPVGVLLITIVGLIILYRSSNWQIGWLMTITGGYISLMQFSASYTQYTFSIRPEAILPLKWPIAWFQSTGIIFVLGLVLVIYPQLFPSGKPLSRRWSVVFWFSLVYLALWTLLVAFDEGTLENELQDLVVPNPYGFIPFGYLGRDGWVKALFILVFLGLTALSVISLVLRFRRARGDEREQMKWIAYDLSVFAFGFWVATIGAQAYFPLLYILGSLLQGIALIGFPLAIGFTILKYRLYDIDRLISRTLVYGGLTGALAFIYFGSVLLLEQIFPSESPIIIVLSTLAIAALFTPLRRRIQDIIDRRFYRRKYDAEQILAEFALSSRDKVNQDELAESLLQVIDDTLQPKSASLWLKFQVTDNRRTI